MSVASIRVRKSRPMPDLLFPLLELWNALQRMRNDELSSAHQARTAARKSANERDTLHLSEVIHIFSPAVGIFDKGIASHNCFGYSI